MTLTTLMKTTIKTSALDFLDGFDYAGVGDDNTIFNAGQTGLQDEFYRKLINSVVKNVGAGTYDIILIVPAPQAEGNLTAEVAVFDAVSGGNMVLRQVLSPTPVFGLEEVRITLRITTTVVN